MTSQANFGSVPAQFDQFIDQAIALHEKAVAAVGGFVRRRFRIAGQLVEFQFAGPALTSLLSDAFGHLETADSNEPALLIHCWDAQSTGVGSPPNFWTDHPLYGHGELSSVVDDHRYLHFYAASAAVSACHRSLRRAIVWVGSATDIPVWEQASPLRALLNWWLSDCGYFNIHGAAVGTASGGALFVGRSGSGKSHAALACLNSDIRYCADDNSLLGTGVTPEIASVYSTVKLFEKDLSRFPLLLRHSDQAPRTDDGKAVFFLNQLAPTALITSFPLRAVLLPHRTHAPDSSLEPASGSEALLHLAPENVLRWPSRGRLAFAQVASVLRAIPCYRLNVGSDLAGLSKEIGTLLAPS